MELGQDVFAYHMMDGMTYVGKPNFHNNLTEAPKEVTLEEYIIMQTSRATSNINRTSPDERIMKEYKRKDKGESVILSLEKKVGFSNISLNLRLKDN